ncbi:MAG: hypothetical protein ACK49R_15115 [Planctomycetota bacterium]|jgi:hypothetical protein
MSTEETELEQLQKSLELLKTCGNDPEACRKLPPQQRHQVVGTKLISFGLEPTVEESQAVTALYEMFCEEASQDERRHLLNSTADFVEQNQGNGVSALWIFLAVDPDKAIRLEASLIYSVLHPQLEGEEPFSGPRKVLRFLEKQVAKNQEVAAAFHGLLNLGDERLIELLSATWQKLPETNQIETTSFAPTISTHAVVEFYLRLLETGCSDELFGNICGFLARLPRQAVEGKTGILDIEREFPAYADEEPIKVLEQWNVGDYLEIIRPRLERISADEAEPKVIPQVIEIWEEAAAREDE